MKKLTVFFLLLMMALPIIAQERWHGGGHDNTTSLTIVSSKHQKFWVFVDDVLQNDDPVNAICIRKFRNKEYYVRVEFDNKLHNCVGQYIKMDHPIAVNLRQSKEFYGMEFTQVNIRPELTMDLLLPVAPVEQEHPSVVPPPIPMHPTPMPPMCQGMNPKDYEEACRLLSNETYDDTRLTVAEQVVAKNPMSVNQIANICKMFTFESNKLEFAKFAYPTCVDQNKYYMLKEVFTYDSSWQELSEFINKVP